jgi:NDP-sugar pyrophosphorylase family protein
MNAVVLCGGMATRMGAICRAVPKALVPICDKPCIDHILGWLRDNGIYRVAINTRIDTPVLAQHVGDGSESSMNIVFLHEHSPAGTANTIRRARSIMRPEQTLVVYGDTITNASLVRIKNAHWGHGLTLLTMPGNGSGGLVETKRGRVLEFTEGHSQPHGIYNKFAGVALINEDVQVDGDDFGRDSIPAIIGNGVPVAAIDLAQGEYAFDIGTINGYQETQAALSESGSIYRSGRRSY